MPDETKIKTCLSLVAKWTLVWARGCCGGKGHRPRNTGRAVSAAPAGPLIFLVASTEDAADDGRWMTSTACRIRRNLHFSFFGSFEE